LRATVPTDSLRAPVRLTCERIAIPPTCCGHIDRGEQANLCNLLRSASPTSLL
jgi:hypothetical protein